MGMIASPPLLPFALQSFNGAHGAERKRVWHDERWRTVPNKCFLSLDLYPLPTTPVHP